MRGRNACCGCDPMWFQFIEGNFFRVAMSRNASQLHLCYRIRLSRRILIVEKIPAFYQHRLYKEELSQLCSLLFDRTYQGVRRAILYWQRGLLSLVNIQSCWFWCPSVCVIAKNRWRKGKVPQLGLSGIETSDQCIVRYWKRVSRTLGILVLDHLYYLRTALSRMLCNYNGQCECREWP